MRTTLHIQSFTIYTYEIKKNEKGRETL